MNRILKIVFLLNVIAIYSCNVDSVTGIKDDSDELQNVKRSIPIEQFTTWIADKENNLVRIKEISELKYQLSYTPKEYLAYHELGKGDFSKEQFEEAQKHYAGMTYFNFRIEKNEGTGELLKHNLSSAQEYNNRLNYISFQMQNDIFLVQDKDTVLPGLYHFERVFEAAPYATVMIAFDNNKFNPENEFTIVYNDRLFKKGFIKYNYKAKQLIDLPKISGV